MRKFFLIVPAAAAAVIFFTTCKKSGSSVDIQGTWKAAEISGRKASDLGCIANNELIFSGSNFKLTYVGADTCYYVQNGVRTGYIGAPGQADLTGTWVLNGDVITLTFSAGDQENLYLVSDGSATDLESDNIDTPTVFVR